MKRTMAPRAIHIMTWSKFCWFGPSALGKRLSAVTESIRPAENPTRASLVLWLVPFTRKTSAAPKLVVMLARMLSRTA